MRSGLRRQLRDEANSVKDCFTRFSFQALAFSALVLGAIANYQQNEPLVALAGILVIVVVLTVSRIGAYKYATANRHFAYELYADTLGKGDESDVPWEVALRAWRVVGAAVFDELYVTPNDRSLNWFTRQRQYNRVERRIEERRAKIEHDTGTAFQWWFDVREQLVAGVTWYPGRYLQTMQSVLHLVAAFAVVPLFAAAIQLRSARFDQLRISIGSWDVSTTVAWLVASAAAGSVALQARHIKARRQILEFGVLSIPSSAVLWSVVIQAHRLASRASRKRPEWYLTYLSVAARSARRSADRIWEWLADPRAAFEQEKGRLRVAGTSVREDPRLR